MVEPVYDEHEKIQEFFNSFLGFSKLYRRVSAYYDRRTLHFLSKGIKKLLLNNGRIEFILSTELKDKKTIDEILSGYEEKKKLNDSIEAKLVNDEDLLSLKFLIKIGKIDIKIAKTESGIFHDKFGLLFDAFGNIIMFSGSNNETIAALNSNYESFETSITWDSSDREKEKIQHRINKFEQFWSNKVEHIDVWPAENFFALNFGEKINNDKPIEIPNGFKEKMLLLDFYGKSNQFIFNSNITDLKEYFNNFDGEIHKNKFQSFTHNKIISKENMQVEDILSVYEFINKSSVAFGDSIILTRSFESIIDALYLDLNSLSKLGEEIKDKEFLSSPEFNSFKENVNSLVKRPLRDAQIQSAYHLINLRRTMNFSVPGSGKTASVLGAFSYLLQKNEVDKLIVIGPLNSFKSWKDEYKKVFLNTGKFDVYDSRNDSSSNISTILSNDYQKLKIILINYETLPQILKTMKKFVKPNSLIVFDEIHRVKRIDGSYANAVIDLAKSIKYRVALTGTPIPNGYLDLFNLFKTLFSNYSSSYFGFDESYLKKISKKYEKNKIEDSSLNQRIYPFFIRISKYDLEVPAPNEDNVIEIEQNHLSIEFNKIHLDSDKNFLLKTAKLVQFSSIGRDLINEKLVIDEIEGHYIDLLNSNNDDIFTESKKMIKTLQIIQELHANGKSVIVWCVFVKSIDALHRYLNANNINNRVIYGQTDSLTRDQNINDFNAKKYDVLISNPSTLAESVSLHHACHDAIYFELTFNLSHYLQSRDRIHRLGISDDQETNYYILQSYYDGISIDSKIYNRLNEKEAVMKKAIDRGELILDSEITFDELFD